MNQKKTEFMKNVLAGIGVCAILFVAMMVMVDVSSRGEDQSALVLQGTSPQIKAGVPALPSPVGAGGSAVSSYECKNPQEFGRGEAGYGNLALSLDGKEVFSLNGFPDREVVKTNLVDDKTTQFAKDYQPGDIVINSSGIYITDYAGGKIYKYDNAGKILNTWFYYNNPNKKPNPRKGISGPGILAQDPISKNYYLVEANQSIGQNIVVLSLAYNPFAPNDAGYVKDFGKRGNGVGEFNSIADLVIDTDGTIFISDSNLHKIMAFENSGKLKFEFGSKGSADGQFSSPQGIVIVGGHIYVVDRWNNRVQIFDKKTGKFVSKFGFKGSGDGAGLNNPVFIIADKDGSVYVLDLLAGNVNRLKKFTQPCARITVTKKVTPTRAGDVFDFVSNVAPSFQLSDGGRVKGVTTFDVVERKSDNFIEETVKVGYKTSLSCVTSSSLDSGQYLDTKGAKVLFSLFRGQKVECGYTNCKAKEGEACVSPSDTSKGL